MYIDNITNSRRAVNICVRLFYKVIRCLTRDTTFGYSMPEVWAYRDHTVFTPNQELLQGWTEYRGTSGNYI